MGDSRKPDTLLEQIHRLAEGPARPVLKKAVGEWLDQEYWALRHAVEQKEKCLATSPFPLNEHSASFPRACAELAVLHEKTEPFYLLRPDLRSGSYRHFAWEMLCKDVDDPKLRHIRNLLDYVRAELRNRGVALLSREESTAEGDVAAEGGAAETESTPTGPGTKKKRSTIKGEGRVKIIAELTKHHKYADGGSLNQEPIGVGELARLADAGKSSASRFFAREFKGHAKYRAMCADVTQLVAALKLLNQEFSPYRLYGAVPPDKGGRDDEGDGDDE